MFKSQGPVCLTFKQHCCGRINWFIKRSKRLYYKQLNETGEKVGKKEVKGDQIEGVSNLFATTSISEEFQSLNTEESKNKHQVDALVIDEETIGEDIDNYNDENGVQNMLLIE